jgi:hypothetical protein
MLPGFSLAWRRCAVNPKNSRSSNRIMNFLVNVNLQGNNGNTFHGKEFSLSLLTIPLDYLILGQLKHKA